MRCRLTAETSLSGGMAAALLAMCWGVCSAPAQTVTAVATFNNVGLEVAFPAPPPPDTEVNLFLRRERPGEKYRAGHPLARVSDTVFAGSALGLEDGTAYSMRLESASFPSNLLLTVTTRKDHFADAPGATWHVDPERGRDDYDGRSRSAAVRTLRCALQTASAGDTVLLHGGRYREGDVRIATKATEDCPLVIRAAPGENPVFDGTDTDFVPAWAEFDAENRIYRTPCTLQPVNAYLDGKQFFHCANYEDLRSDRWSQGSGYYVDGSHMYARFPGGGTPSPHAVTVPCLSVGLVLDEDACHVHIIGIEFRYYGREAIHRGIYINGAHSNLIDRCVFRHVGPAIGIRRDAWHNTIQRCRISDPPLATWSWEAAKASPYGYESGGVAVYPSPTVNAGNVIRHNVFSNLFDGSLLYTGDPAGATKHMDVHDNVFELCGDDAIETDGVGSNVRIYSNTFRDFRSGISVAPCELGPTYIVRNVFGPSPTFGPNARSPIKFNVRSSSLSQWIYLYHNTMFTDVADQDGFVMYEYSRWTNVISRNNIFAGTSHGFYGKADPNPIDFDYDNICDSSGPPFGRWKGERCQTFEDFQRASGMERHGWSLDSAFVSPATGNFRLKRHSPMIDKGLRIPGINDTYAGDGPDIGAWEYQPPARGLRAVPANRLNREEPAGPAHSGNAWHPPPAGPEGQALTA